MGKALRLNLHPRAVTLVGIIARGERSFTELHPRDKEILFQTIQNGFDPQDLIPEQELRIYEAQRQLEQSEGRLEEIAAAARLKIYETRENLRI